MDYYIVRIYRQEKKKSHDLVGIVEAVDPKDGRKEKKAFTTFEELREILNDTGRMLERKKQGRGADRRGEKGKGRTYDA